MFASLIAIIALALIIDTRSRMKRLEHRLGLLEDTPPKSAGVRVPKPVTPQPKFVEAKHIPEPAAPKPVEPQPAERAPAPAMAVTAPPAKAVEMEATPKPTSFSFSFEDLFGRRLPIWAGGITLAVAGVLIVKYAIDSGLLTHWVRVLGGFLFGAALIAGAEAAMRNESIVRDARVRQALSGAGLATLYATILMASNAYDLIVPFAAFVLMAGVTAAALGLSIRFGAPSALLGLAGGLATPALVGSLQPDIPLLSVYLALTIAGLAGVSRMQRWAWLGIAALVGGAGWSLWMILASNALDTMASLSMGGLVLLLAMALPVLAFEGPRATLLRVAAALVGAAQLAMLVAIGGFSLLHWGLFGLIAAAGQWLNWREKDFDIVPSVSLGLAVILLAAYPDPELGEFALVGIAMALIHGIPLTRRLWQSPPSERVALELCGLSLATVAVPMIHFYRLDQSRDMAFALLALAASAIPAIGLVRGWTDPVRVADRRFGWLTASAGLLLVVACAFATPLWALPLGAALIAAAMLLLGQRADDGRIEAIASGFGLASIVLLGVSSKLPLTEWSRLVGQGGDTLYLHALFRWAGLALAATLFAVRASAAAARIGGQVLAVFLGYGAAAQLVSGDWLALVSPLALAGLALWTQRLAWPRLAPAMGVSVMLTMLWAAVPLLSWSGYALLSLAAEPMPSNIPYLGLHAIAKQLLVPAALAGAALWMLRAQAPHRAKLAGAIAIGVVSAIGLHGLYRIGFAALVGSDFVATGLAQRLLWAGLLITAGGLAWRFAQTRLAAAVLIAAGALHTLYYSLLLHNPLWAEQAVGSWPVANLLIPTFALVPLGTRLLQQILPDRTARFVRIFDGIDMVTITLFAYATLRQAFHGSLLTAPGLGDFENILVSILAIALAIGFLLWGIHARKRDWRIASLVLMIAAVAKVFLLDASGLEGLLRIGSFVALGFSLIGIGWLYSRQLGASEKAAAAG